MPATVRYQNGTAAVFASKADAVVQAAHDNEQGGNLTPAYIVEGDQSQAHGAWRDQLIQRRIEQRVADQQAAVERGEDPASLPSAEADEAVPVDVDPPDGVRVLLGRKATEALRCECVECEFGRRTRELPPGAGDEKLKLWEELQGERLAGERA